MTNYTFTPRQFQKLQEEAFKLGRLTALEKGNSSHKQKLLLRAYEIMREPFKFLNNKKQLL